METLRQEAGGHRWQRVPPTEKKGRVHTSTVTVAVLVPTTQERYILKESEVEIIRTRDSGPGGQNRNKVESCVVVKHKQFNVQAKAAKRDQHKNKKKALETVENRINEILQEEHHKQTSQARQQQVGSGMRGDKVRTYRSQEDQVTNHLNNKKVSLKKVYKGELEELWT